MSHLPKKPAGPKPVGFTILELLIVVAVIAILSGLTISTAGFIQNRVARARASAEIQGISVGLENYKMEIGEYPQWTNGSPGGTANPTNGTTTNVLLVSLCPASSSATSIYNPSAKVFYAFSKSMVTNVAATTSPITDPFGVPYGYCCPATKNPSNSYDLWSTSGKPSDSNMWIKNW